MSAMLESLLHASGDLDRLGDIARNDAALGITPPPVEMDEFFAQRSDLAMPSAEQAAERNDRRAMQLQVERNHSQWGIA